MIKTLFFFAGFLFLTIFLNQKIKTVMAALDDLKAAVQKETEVD